MNVITKGSVGFDMEDTANVNVTNASMPGLMMCRIESQVQTLLLLKVVESLLKTV